MIICKSWRASLFEILFNDRKWECLGCVEKGFLEPIEDEVEYRCGNCGHEGNIRDELATKIIFG